MHARAQDALAACGRDPEPKAVEDISFLAGRLDEVLRACLAGSEASGGGSAGLHCRPCLSTRPCVPPSCSPWPAPPCLTRCLPLPPRLPPAAAPGLREWAKRCLRGLASIALYEPPVERERAAQEAARRERRERRSRRRRSGAEGGEGPGSEGSGGDDGLVSGDDSSTDVDADAAAQRGGDDDRLASSSASSIDGTGGVLPVNLPPSLYQIQNMAKGRQPPPAFGAPAQVAMDAEGLPAHGQVRAGARGCFFCTRGGGWGERAGLHVRACSGVPRRTAPARLAT